MDSKETVVFLKLGGSLITDKGGVEKVRLSVLDRLSKEIAAALKDQPGLKMVIGHGSGSFGHVAADKHGTRQGVHDREGWIGLAEVSSAAARLNQIVRQALLKEGIPALTIQPSASAMCLDGPIITMETRTIRKAIKAGLIPLIYGDVAFDEVRGGTIISTEEIFTFLTPFFKPGRILLAGETPGVFDRENRVIPLINSENIDNYRGVLSGSGGTDVTGGMLTKVQSMLNLAEMEQGLSIVIFSGMVEGALTRLIGGKQIDEMTLIKA
ncbi:MAG: isopentenyl phosphate kinase [Anaerolineae bacterium]|nr:MAG: isopentenyl phosphate kinase [Anaerolineae bacterium]